MCGPFSGTDEWIECKWDCPYLVAGSSPKLLTPWPLTVPLPYSGPPIAQASGSSLHRWSIISEFQYRPGGPVINFLNTQLLDAVVEAFLTPWSRWKRSAGPRNNVTFHPIYRRDVHSIMARESLSWGQLLG